MAARYYIRLLDQDGVQVGVITDWRELKYTTKVNNVGSLKLTIDGDLPVVDLFVLDGQVEVRREDIAASPVITRYIDFEGFIRLFQRQTNTRGLATFMGGCVNYSHLLARRVIYYRQGDAQESKTGVGETVMKQYVNENAGPGAVSPPRVTAGVFTGLTIETDLALGGSWGGSRSFRNLQETLQGIANATNMDFGIVGIGPALFEFQARPIWGVDRTVTGLDPVSGLNAAGNAPVIFSLDYDNMQGPDYSLNRIGEVTAVIILGQGSEGDRIIEERTDAVAIAESPLNRVESVQNASEEAATAGLAAAGDAILEKLQAKESFDFDVMQIPGLLYGRDYFLGDLVTARYQGIERNKQIGSVTVTVAEGKEDISISVTDVT